MDFCTNYLRYYQYQFRIVSKAGRFLLCASCERKTVEKIPGRLFWNFLRETRLRTSLCVRFSARKHEDAWKVTVSLMSLISTSEHSNRTRASTWGLEISRPDDVNLRTRFMQTFIQECGQTGSGPLMWKTSGGIHLCMTVWELFSGLVSQTVILPLTEVCRMKVCRQQSEAPSMSSALAKVLCYSCSWLWGNRISLKNKKTHYEASILNSTQKFVFTVFQCSGWVSALTARFIQVDLTRSWGPLRRPLNRVRQEVNSLQSELVLLLMQYHQSSDSEPKHAATVMKNSPQTR